MGSIHFNNTSSRETKEVSYAVHHPKFDFDSPVYYDVMVLHLKEKVRKLLFIEVLTRGKLRLYFI